uniref:Tenascin N n=1 Tax=Erpetoichthys calabaricus TaxID=27687 RepID=A0A8C4X9E7_ERPCA
MVFQNRLLILLGVLYMQFSLIITESQSREGEHGLTFSHVYKIDLPKSSSCNVELDSLPAKDQGSEMVTSPEGQLEDNNLVFRHNIRLQTPKCDCESSDAFKSMLLRLSRLEEEVNSLKDQCSQGCCGGGKGGIASLCSNHGTFKRETCECDCDEGWEGEDCSTRSCPNDCTDNGRCEDGKCICYQGYAGVDCSELLCPGDCSDKGHCVDGVCQCFEGFMGDDCSQRRCPNDCSNNGKCNNGVCICDEGFTGHDCSKVLGPKNLRLVRATEESLLVDWEHVPGAEYYVITYHPAGAEGSIQQIRVPRSQNSYLITGLMPGVKYIIQLYAVIKETSSQPSSLEASTVIYLIDQIKVISQTEDSIHVEWKNPPTEVDYFKLTVVMPDGQEKEIRVAKGEGAKTSYIIKNLLPGTMYLIRVQSVHGDAEGKPSSVNGMTELDSPTNLVTKSVTEDTATLSWNKVLAPIDSYRISYSSADGQSQEISVGADKNTHMLTGLRPGVEYTIYIWAIKGNRKSKKASTKAVTDLDSPTNLLTKSVTEDTATLSWNKVLAPVDGYRISYSSADGQSQEITVGAEKNSHKLTGLRPGVEYRVYVWAVKGNQNSKKASTQATTDIDSPTNLVATSVTEDTVALSWNKVLAPVDGYRISYISADGQSQEISVGAEKNSHKLTGLRPGVEYTIYIWAVKGNRKSKKTSTKATTNIDAPTNLKVTDVKQSNGIVTWTPPSASIDGYILTYRRADGNGQETEKQLGPSNTRYTLEGLELGVRYIVRLVAFKGVQRSRVAETTFSTVGIPFPFPMDCTQMMKNGNTTSGIYTIYVNNDRSKPMAVYCDMTTDGGGWIVFQRRNSGKVDFLRRWKNYTQGFGDMNDEFWLGLEKIYELTNTPTQYELRVDLRAGSESVYAVYDSFKLAPSRQKYKISVGNYRGNAGDAMTYHQGRAFTTMDQDNDIALSNCAFSHRGAWWYKNCHLANLNGKYGDSTHSQGINWEPWKGHEFSIPFVEMKIRAHVSSDPTATGRKKRSLAMRGKRIN